MLPTPLLELSTHDSSRPVIPEVAFSADATGSKLIDHLDLLFHADRSSVLSAELKEAWVDFKKKQCRARLPERFCKARAIFIPKKPAAIDPGDFRPISLTSIPARLFSKIVAKRLSPAIKIEHEQRGFIGSDGISQNIFILDYVLRHASEKNLGFILPRLISKWHLTPSPIRRYLQLSRPSQLTLSLSKSLNSSTVIVHLLHLSPAFLFNQPAVSSKETPYRQFSSI
ncbi:hypothetical protein AVEN_199452-1 [Araneus ventricosus]|uniref:Reverse transcriptase domain-containing protein n=1 Tax=Araneus ventricosus TaxID=182803 RepID=A0A4Y2LDN6_ARAVE|nr:hypothetical protein AVEN_199452-1 [Araneus ventricosus]